MTRKGKVNPANVISFLRAVLAFVAAFLLIEVGGWQSGMWAAIIIIAAMVSDALDGIIARALGYESEVGKLTDICADHILANTVWVTLVLLGPVPIWVALITTTRDIGVNFFRQVGFLKTGLNGFEQVHGSRWGWISSSRIMRFFYASVKTTVWCLAITELFLPASGLVRGLAWFTAGLCLLRAIPAVTAGWRHVFFAEPT